MADIITLTKDHGEIDISRITRLVFGAAWDDSTGLQGRVRGWVNRKEGADLDLIAVFFQTGAPVRYAGFDNVEPFANGCVRHSGDAVNGRASGDDESVEIDFTKIPDNVDKVVVFVAAFKPRADFNKAKNVSFNIYDGTGGTVEQVAEIMPSLIDTGNAHRVATVLRTAQGWGMRVDDVRGRVNRGDVPGLYGFAAR